MNHTLGMNSVSQTLSLGPASFVLQSPAAHSAWKPCLKPKSEKSCWKINNSVPETGPKDRVDILGRLMKWQLREAVVSRANNTFLQLQEQQVQLGVQGCVPSASSDPVSVKTVVC